MMTSLFVFILSAVQEVGIFPLIYTAEVLHDGLLYRYTLTAVARGHSLGQGRCLVRLHADWSL